MIYYIISVRKVYIFNNFIVILNFSDFHFKLFKVFQKFLAAEAPRISKRFNGFAHLLHQKIHLVTILQAKKF